ncbi:gamma-glutamyl-gamma-aminobutyrate hydrolase family protein [Thermococcus sp. AM4]|uniref:gamma-glutamyl-gamma-aminobutyrate hydrolase family protein n=1 Tax=Thermococcus sp. (strain AM4) TaxID=246969 RepID=UPI0001870D89|nr:gamma-glutamyl-gamma-aminobutyrate hydrolase family protein [Thermococcus sp. AM4]EEB74891.1 Gamma-glutamyl-GABA hydrolase [Thermococcus sp. AM4]
MKPVIVIIAGSFNDVKSKWILHHSRAIDRAGGIPVIYTSPGDPRDVVEIADGILLTEGPDIHPYFYGEDPSPNIKNVDYSRDKFEIELFRRAQSMDIPVLGVGRGMQIMNIAMNGTMYQDLQREIPKAIKHDWDPLTVDPGQRLHSIRLKTSSKLYDILKDKLDVSSTNEVFIHVNSFHHQGIKRVGEGFRAVAFSIDGIAEAIESKEGFYIGVQWNPQFLPEMIALYEAFVRAAKESQRRRIEREQIEVEAEDQGTR